MGNCISSVNYTQFKLKNKKSLSIDIYHNNECEKNPNKDAPCKKENDDETKNKINIIAMENIAHNNQVSIIGYNKLNKSKQNKKEKHIYTINCDSNQDYLYNEQHEIKCEGIPVANQRYDKDIEKQLKENGAATETELVEANIENNDQTNFCKVYSHCEKENEVDNNSNNLCIDKSNNYNNKKLHESSNISPFYTNSDSGNILLKKK